MKCHMYTIFTINSFYNYCFICKEAQRGDGTFEQKGPNLLPLE